MLNTVPRKLFKGGREVRQCDPLSQLLVVLAPDFLRAILNDVMDMGILQAPIRFSSCTKFTILQCADDTLIDLQASPTQLTKLKGTIYIFSRASGLKVNYHKYSWYTLMCLDLKPKVSREF